MVGIGTLPDAREWVKENSGRFPFPFLLDPRMKFYRELGLKRTVAGVWTIPVLTNFAEKLIAGTLEMEHFEKSDVHMIAGDYLTDASGKLLLAYNSATSDDRPSTETIFIALDAAAQSE